MTAKERKSRNQRNYLLYTLVSALIGAAVGYAAITLLLKPRPGHGHFSWWDIAAIFIIVFPPLMLHEAGHVVFGLTQGFRFNFFVAGPVYIRRDGEKIAFTWNWNPVLWGGRASCFPTQFGPDLKWKMIWFTAGGPLFSFLGALAVIPAMTMRASHSGTALPVMFFGIVSFALGVATLIPNSVGGATSDGARILILLRNRPEGMRWVAMAGLASLISAQRARDWPAGLVELMGEAVDETPDSASVCTLRYLWHSDRREWDDAAHWLDRGLQKIDMVPAPLRGAMYASAASFEVRRPGNIALAREYFDLACRPGLVKRRDLHALAARVLLAEGRHEEARAELALAEESIRSQPPALAEPLREDLDDMASALA